MWLFSVWFLALPVFVQVIGTATNAAGANTSTNAATTSSPKCVVSLVPDSIPSFF